MELSSTTTFSPGTSNDLLTEIAGKDYADAPDRSVELLDSNRKHRERVTVIAQSGNNTDLAACLFKGTED